MVQWRFGESEDDGEIWLTRPSRVPIYVDYQSQSSVGGLSWRRLLVATKSWLDEQLTDVRYDDQRPRWAALPQMVVVPDAGLDELRRTIKYMLQERVFDQYSTPLEAGS